MINLITISDFLQPFMVFAGTDETEMRLTEIIAEVQHDFLIEILGHELYYELENDNSGNFPTSQKWIDFINGVDYVKSDIKIGYKGIKKALAYRVYYFYNKYMKSILQENQEGNLLNPNSEQIIPIQKMTEAYNSAGELIYDYKTYSPTIYNYLNDTSGFDSLKFSFSGYANEIF